MLPESTPPPQGGDIAFSRAALYGLANLAYFLGYSAFNTYALFFYSEHLHVPAALIGQAWLLFGVWNTLNDGLCGWLADRVPLRLGRRSLPVLLLGVPVGAMFLLVFNPPGWVTARGPAGLVWYFLVTVSLYDLLQTIVNISQGAAFPEMTADDRGRARLAAIRQGLGIGGTALGVAVTPLVFGRFGWGAVGLLWGALIGVLNLVSVRGFGKAQPGPDREPSDWKRSLRLLAGNRAVRSFLLVQVCFRFALACVQIGLPFYAAHVVPHSGGQLAMVLGALLTTAALTLPVWPWLLRRLDPRATAMLITGGMIVLLVPFLWAREITAVLLTAALLGPAYGGIAMVLDLLYAQVVDSDYVRSGSPNAGLLNGAVGTVLRLAPALVGLLLAQMLDASGYDANLPIQPASVAAALRLMMVGLPGLALVAAALCLAQYPLRGALAADLAAEVRQLRSSPPGTGAGDARSRIPR